MPDKLKRSIKQNNEALADCSDFLDDIESRVDDDGNKIVKIPEDFDDIVEIAVDEQTEAIENGEEMLDEDGKPFWMRYFKADYLGESDPKYKNLLLKAGVTNDEGDSFKNNQKKKQLQDELIKVKTLDKQLVSWNRLYKQMKEKSAIRTKETSEKLNRENEAKKREMDKKKKSYIKSHLKRQNSSRGSSKSKESSASKNSSKQMKKF